MSNYYFFSTSVSFNNALLAKEFGNSINIALNRWNELTALRGEYASINTLLEWITRKMLSKMGLRRFINSYNKDTYNDCISTLKDKISKGRINCTLSTIEQKSCFDTWYDCKDSRNILEHNVEKWDVSRRDFLIANHNTSKLFLENKVANYRKELLAKIIEIKKLIDDLIKNNVFLAVIVSEQEYVDFCIGL